MFPLIETAIAFAAAMLAASLVVSGCVQVVLSLGRYRSRGVEEMLLSLMQGFRNFNNDPAVVPQPPVDGKAKGAVRIPPPDPVALQKAERAFVEDVMTDPTLQARGSAAKYSNDPNELARMVEYIDAGDLVVVAVSHAKYEIGEPNDEEMAPRPELKLPQTWFGNGIVPPYFNTKTFADYVGRFFATLEATAAQRFKGRIRQLTVLLAAILVVTFNFDSVQLLRTLYQNSGVRAAVASQAEQIADIAERSGVKAPRTPGTEAPTSAPVVIEETAGLAPSIQVQQAAAALDQPDLGIGWEGSYIIGRFCAYRGTCASTTPPISGGQLAIAISLWCFGLIASCVMLSFGAPFWYGTLKQLLNLGNELKGKKVPSDGGDSTATPGTGPSSGPFSMRPSG
jgi:hypothetical protein